MSVLLIGRWSDGETTLTIIESHQVPDGDQDAIDRLFGEALESGTGDWACAYDVDWHHDAVQRTYEETARPAGADIEDDVEHFEPVAY